MEITSWSIFKTEYCTNYLSGTNWETCDQWVTVYSLTKQDVKELWASIIVNGWVMFVVVFVVLFVVKFIFLKLFR